MDAGAHVMTSADLLPTHPSPRPTAPAPHKDPSCQVLTARVGVESPAALCRGAKYCPRLSRWTGEGQARGRRPPESGAKGKEGGWEGAMDT